jgi:hypothetical protein
VETGQERVNAGEHLGGAGASEQCCAMIGARDSDELNPAGRRSGDERVRGVGRAVRIIDGCDQQGRAREPVHRRSYRRAAQPQFGGQRQHAQRRRAEPGGRDQRGLRTLRRPGQDHPAVPGGAQRGNDSGQLDDRVITAEIPDRHAEAASSQVMCERQPGTQEFVALLREHNGDGAGPEHPNGQGLARLGHVEHADRPHGEAAVQRLSPGG